MKFCFLISDILKKIVIWSTQDFTAEQDAVVPPNEWKAHYSVTKAVADVNMSFYKKFKAKSLRGMSSIWLQADYVKCIHPGGELLSG
jgi:6-phosphogluconolactonase (cycloisomerase 2 family)